MSALADNTVRRFTRDGGAIRIRRIRLDDQAPAAGPLFDEVGAYRGG